MKRCPSQAAFYFAREHGSSACGMGFRVKDATKAYAHLIEQGAEPINVETGPMELRLPAIRGIGGVFEGRLVFRSDEEEKRAEKMVDDDLTRLWDATDLCRSDDAIFAASGVCDGYLPGVIVGQENVQTFAELIDVEKGTITRHDRVH